jgi:hypothetical protein
MITWNATIYSNGGKVYPHLRISVLIARVTRKAFKQHKIALPLTIWAIFSNSDIWK